DDLRVGQGVEGLEEVRNRVAAKRGVGQHRLPAYLERRAVVAAQKGVQHDPQAHGAGRGALIGDAVLNPRRVGLPGRNATGDAQNLGDDNVFGPPDRVDFAPLVDEGTDD